MSIVDDLYAYLESTGFTGGSTGWAAMRRRLMDEPALDQVVVITEDGGPPPEIAAGEGIGDAALADVGVLLTVRAAQWDGDASYVKAEDIRTALHGLRDVVLGASGAASYLRVRAMTPEPVFLGYDDRGRPRHTIAFRLLRAV